MMQQRDHNHGTELYSGGDDSPTERDSAQTRALNAAGLEKVIKKAGNRHRIYAALTAAGYRLSKQATGNWRRVPAHWVLPIEQELGVHRSIQRPDLYPPHEYPTREECAA